MEGISDELRRKGVAASTIRDALGDYRQLEMLRIIAKLAKAPATLEALLEIKSEARSFYILTHELEQAMTNGGLDIAQG